MLTGISDPASQRESHFAWAVPGKRLLRDSVQTPKELMRFTAGVSKIQGVYLLVKCLLSRKSGFTRA